MSGNKDNFLDELLDASLTQYTKAEPRPGLEQRILSSVRESQQHRLRLDWRWVPATAVVAAVVAVAVYSSRPPAVPHPATRLAGVAQSAPPAIGSTAKPEPPPQAAAAVRRPLPGGPQERPVAAVPRAATFPRPAPLSPNEQLLLRYLDRAPRHTLVASASSALPLGDVVVPEVKVSPLQMQPLSDRTGELN